jgi:hypothetical protein
LTQHLRQFCMLALHLSNGAWQRLVSIPTNEH